MLLLSPALLLCGLLDGCQLLDLYSAVSIILRRPWKPYQGGLLQHISRRMDT